MNKKIKDIMEISPLGGVGQIGSNSTLIKFKDKSIIIDCGILFPNETFFDINYLIPDLSSIHDNISAIIITHGHEDHIGAIHHYIEKFPNAEIFAPSFARSLILEKLKYKKISKTIALLPSSLDFDCFKLKSFHVNHSIPDTKGIMINSNDLNLSLLFISDFKVNATQYLEEIFDFSLLEKQNEFHHRIALLDSTNIQSSNLETPSEESLFDSLLDIFKESSEDIYITTFASNIYRIQTIINIAKKFNRFVIPYGRSMIKYINIALKEGFLEDSSGRLKDPEDKSIKNRVILCSGCQGDFKGAARRVILGKDPRFKLKKNDSFIFSSKPIPGNEKVIARLYNEIISQKVKLYHNKNNHVHVSGHPGKSDLKKIYEKYKPTHSFPIHGETSFLEEHKKFVLENNLSINSSRIKNGDQIFISKNGIKIIENESKQPVLIHGNALIIEREKISERRKLATLGLIIISLSKESISKFKPSFEITTKGLPLLFDQKMDDLQELLQDTLKSYKSKKIEDKKEKLRIVTRRFSEQVLGYRPIVTIHIC